MNRSWYGALLTLLALQLVILVLLTWVIVDGPGVQLRWAADSDPFIFHCPTPTP